MQPYSCINLVNPNETRYISSYCRPNEKSNFSIAPNALAEQFDTTRQAVSKHINILAECQLLKQEKDRKGNLLSFNPTKMKEIGMWLEQFKKHWEDRFNQLDQILVNLNSKKNEK